MIKIKRHLPPTHKHNVEAAKALGLVYDESLRDWVPKKRHLVSGNGSNDTRWGKLSESDKVHAHK